MRRNAGGDGTRPLTGHCHHRHYWARPRPAQVAAPLPPPPPPLSLNNLRTKNMTPTISSSNPLNILSRPLDHSHIFYVSLFGCSRVPTEEFINFDIKAKSHKTTCQ